MNIDNIIIAVTNFTHYHIIIFGVALFNSIDLIKDLIENCINRKPLSISYYRILFLTALWIMFYTEIMGI